MTDAPPSEADIAVPHRGRGRPKDETVTLTKAARARFDKLAAESIDAVFQAVLTAATQDGDMAAAKLLIDRIIPSRRGARRSRSTFGRWPPPQAPGEGWHHHSGYREGKAGYREGKAPGGRDR